MEHAHSARAVVVRGYRLKTKCGGPRFDSLVHHACSCDDNSINEISLAIATALNARSAGPDCSTARHEVGDEFSERVKRVDLGGKRASAPDRRHCCLER